MANIKFPSSAQDFKELYNLGKYVEYTETTSESTQPNGDGWVFWSMKITPEEEVAIWRRIKSL